MTRSSIHDSISKNNTLLKTSSQLIAFKDYKYHSWFTFDEFNKIQERCLPEIMRNDENIVISAPTGSGKTTLFELAMMKFLQKNEPGKIVYLSPMRALCSEKSALWSPKMKSVGKSCIEMIGGTDSTESQIEQSDLIITTPEKMDYLTRSGNLITEFSLILIDEVHTLNDSRGAVLEALISRVRLKTRETGQNCRIIAVSATIPNINNIATWLRSSNTHSAAKVLSFPDSMRPVPLKTHVIASPMNGKNGFTFDFSLNYKIPDILSRHSDNKPTIIFCSTRKSTTKTADFLTMNQSKTSSNLQYIVLDDHHLKELIINYGVAYHHAGLSSGDRELIESLFRENKISVLCSTSTLAVGVNLPAHLVIIKSTLQYTESGYSEYSDLDVRQMMGRAGRAGFDTSGIAVILTSTDTEHLYRSISEGKLEIDSKLLPAFIEFLCVEVINGNVKTFKQAISWFSFSFLSVRMKLNPKKYSLITTEPFDNQIEKSIDLYLNELKKLGIIDYDGDVIRSTQLGQAMARNYIKFKSIKEILKNPLNNNAEISNLLRIISQSPESVLEIRGGDKALLSKIASNPRLTFPIPGKSNYWEPWKKSFLLMQIALQCELAEFEGKLTPIQRSDQHSIIENSIRVLKFVIELGVQMNLAVLLRNALELLSSLHGLAWHSNPKIHQQIPGIGIISANTLFNAGIRSISSLREIDESRLEVLLKRNPPFGRNTKKELASIFPVICMKCDISEKEREMKIEISMKAKFENENPSKIHLYLLGIAYSSSGEDRVILYEKLSLLNLEKFPFKRFVSLKESLEKSFSCSLMFENWAGLNQNICFEIESSQKHPKLGNIDSVNDDTPPLQHFIQSTKEKIVPVSPVSNPKSPQMTCKHKCKDRLGCAHPCCKMGLLSVIDTPLSAAKTDKKPLFMSGAKKSLTNAREYLRKYQPMSSNPKLLTSLLEPQARGDEEALSQDEIEFVLRSIE